MNVVDNSIINQTQAKAKASPRKRAAYCLHQPADYLQRLLIVGYKGTYWPPSKNSTKLKIFVMLRGQAALVIFDDHGAIIEVAFLGKDTSLVEVTPGTWHSFVALSESVAFMEIIEGFYDPATHKEFPEWGVAEDDPKAGAYLKQLTKNIGEFAA